MNKIESLFKSVKDGILGKSKKESRVVTREEMAEDLLTDGVIEFLVLEGRTPIRVGTTQVGTVGSGEFQKFQNYQIPPAGFEPSKIKDVSMEMGTFLFTHQDGYQEYAISYDLTDEQAAEVEQRIIDAKKLLVNQDVES